MGDLSPVNVPQINMHVSTKNVQSIRDRSKHEDVVAEVNNADFDVMLLSETWREDSEGTFLTVKQHKIVLSGGLRNKGVGICVS